MRLIDADALDLDREVELADDWKTAHEIANCVKYAPTIDAAPVIRCKDCKWYDTEYHCKLNGCSCGRSPDWFCADGKKEEEECTSTDTEH